ncbi:MAG: hypothetical protein QNJ54_08560 [Prochloraceae cyanobacterium]|nr:hypothetical protein [Prochloraceae cyanobacterium]
MFDSIDIYLVLIDKFVNCDRDIAKVLERRSQMIIILICDRAWIHF